MLSWTELQTSSVRLHILYHYAWATKKASSNYTLTASSQPSNQPLEVNAIRPPPVDTPLWQSRGETSEEGDDELSGDDTDGSRGPFR